MSPKLRQESSTEHYEMEEPWIAVEPPSSPHTLQQQSDRKYSDVEPPILLNTLNSSRRLATHSATVIRRRSIRRDIEATTDTSAIR